ncbi:hypothetical protein LUZ61_006597 [Rhynchospora tenuis]|uniref:Protein FAR1-RELATED SEQUENCE n=1 Tax=Rhynchospora tenuis TaxID=198213 RepID=A0AAD5ZRX5_9POAL|nr:hypothetical protein LUZ61_006597 [Rhynchospora tenuis]
MGLNECTAVEVEPESNRLEASDTNHQRTGGLKLFKGMVFTSLEEAEEIYKAFAKANGFTVRIRNTRPGLRGSISSRHFVCSCQGFYVEKKEKELSIANEKDRRTLTRRCGCEAMLVVKWDKKKNEWIAHKFSNDHNHNMVSPNSKCYLIPSKCMPTLAKNHVEKFNETGLSIGKVPAILGNMEGVNFNERDCYNHMRDKRRKDLIGGDAQAVVEYCRRKQNENPNFFYAIDCDNEDRMINFFWVEARGRLYYEKFGDVLVFDTTYRTNKYQMPFANFVGVNNHLQSIFFGCALLQDEQEESFVWLFETWLEAMHGKAPISILTDQDKAIGNAVKRVFPNTTHRLCLWHITDKFPKKIGICKKGKESGFQKDISKCIRESITPEAFEKDWQAIIERYKLESNTWLSGLYEIRHSWIPVYNQIIFFAGVNTTQRSESMHSFFDSFVNSGTTLREFVTKYEKALECRYLDEKEEHYVSKYKFPTKAKSPLELHGAKVYTRKVFNLFQIELTEEETYGKLVKMESPISMTSLEESVQHEVNDHSPLQDPAISQTKGRKKDTKVSRNGRIMSGVEVSIKRRRKCSFCKGWGHDARTCEQRNQDVEG